MEGMDCEDGGLAGRVGRYPMLLCFGVLLRLVISAKNQSRRRSLGIYVRFALLWYSGVCGDGLSVVHLCSLGC